MSRDLPSYNHLLSIVGGLMRTLENVVSIADERAETEGELCALILRLEMEAKEGLELSEERFVFFSADEAFRRQIGAC